MACSQIRVMIFAINLRASHVDCYRYRTTVSSWSAGTEKCEKNQKIINTLFRSCLLNTKIQRTLGNDFLRDAPFF
jgi:hypothetical protein